MVRDINLARRNSARCVKEACAAAFQLNANAPFSRSTANFGDKYFFVPRVTDLLKG
jgi:hypothetical protein